MRTLLVALLLLVPTMAAAQDLTAVYQYHDGTRSRLYARGDDAFRMATSDDAYMLITGGQTYMCRKTDQGWRATDVNKLMRTYGGAYGTQQRTPEVKVTFRSMGKTERVAGYMGRVYELSVYEDGKLTRRDEVVMSTHSDVKRLTRAWAEMSSSMSTSMGQSATSIEDLALRKDTEKYGGILRYGDEMRLRELKLKELPVNFFDLPPMENQWGDQPSTEPADNPYGDSGQDEPKSDAERINDTVNKIIDIFGN